jgi:outer membrane lipoprotein carrier protein
MEEVNMRLKLFIGVACMVGSVALYAQTAGEMLVLKLNAIKSLSADFNQTVRTKKKQISHEKGHMVVERPGHFRWETKSPVNQLLLADGHQVWIYDPELEQVTIKPQSKAMRGTPASFLSSSNEGLLQDFNVDLEPKGDQEVYQLKAKTAQPTFVSMVLSFKGAQLQSMVLEDQLGQKIDVSLNKVKQNQVIPKSSFQFKTPKGVDVIHE